MFFPPQNGHGFIFTFFTSASAYRKLGSDSTKTGHCNSLLNGIAQGGLDGKLSNHNSLPTLYHRTTFSFSPFLLLREGFGAYLDCIVHILINGRATDVQH